MELIPFFIIIAVILLFGIFYSILIYWRPFPPGLTWLSVVIGDLVTDMGSTLVLVLILTNLQPDYLWLALVPFGMHVLTGGPMIVGQVLKHFNQKRHNNNILRGLD
jgi:hypothetical protein